jgi:dimethylargininase
MLLALTRPVSPSIVDCQLTHLARQPIDFARAAAEHAEYERRLAGLGASVRRLPAEPTLPDAAFIEDTAVVVDDLAVITRPGAESRRPETATVAAQLAEHRTIVSIEPPGTLDGGDVLVVDREVYVGRSTRTNDSGIEQLRRALEPLGFRITAIPVTRCLHLKSAVTCVAEQMLLLNPAWIASDAFSGYSQVNVDPTEPAAANAVALGGSILHPSQHRRTRARLEAAGLSVIPVPMTELAKAEAGMTCCSIIFEVS